MSKPKNVRKQLLEKCTDDVPHFKILCGPTKTRLQKFLQVTNSPQLSRDPLNLDFYYCVKGELRFKFELMNQEHEILLSPGQFLDNRLKSNKFPNARLVSVDFSTAETTVIMMPLAKYMEFAYIQRSEQDIQAIFCKLIGCFRQKSNHRRKEVMRSFEEIVLTDNQLIETEGHMPSHLWLILQGQVGLYRRPESLYDEDGKPLDSSKLTCWRNPKDSGNKLIGSKVGTLKSPAFIAEDSLFFQQPMMYSIRCEGKVLAWRLPSSRAFETLPQDYREELMCECLKKYSLIFEQMDQIENQLQNGVNLGEID